MLGSTKIPRHIGSLALSRQVHGLSSSLSLPMSSSLASVPNDLLSVSTASMSSNHKSKSLRKNNAGRHTTKPQATVPNTPSSASSSTVNVSAAIKSASEPSSAAAEAEGSGVRLTPEQMKVKMLYLREFTSRTTKDDLLAFEADLITLDHIRGFATNNFLVTPENYTRMFTLNGLRLQCYDNLLKNVPKELLPEVVNLLLRDAARINYYLASFFVELKINNKSSLLGITSVFLGILSRVSASLPFCLAEDLVRVQLPHEMFHKAVALVEQAEEKEGFLLSAPFHRLLDSLSLLAQPLPEVGAVDMDNLMRITPTIRGDLLCGRLVAATTRVYSDATEGMRSLGGVWYVSDLVLSEWISHMALTFKPMVQLVERQSKLILETMRPDATGATLWMHANTVPMAPVHAQNCAPPYPALTVRSHFSARAHAEREGRITTENTEKEADSVLTVQRQDDWLPVELWDEWGVYQLMRHSVTQSLSLLTDVRRQFTATGLNPEKHLTESLLALTNLATLAAPIRPTAYFEDAAIAQGASTEAEDADVDVTKSEATSLLSARYVGGVGSVCRWMDMLDEQWKGLLSAAVTRELHLHNVLKHGDLPHKVPTSDPLNGIVRLSRFVKPTEQPSERLDKTIAAVDKEMLVDVRYARGYRGFVHMRTPELANYDPRVQAGVCSVYGQHAPGSLAVPVKKHPLVLERAHTLLQTAGNVDIPGVKSTVLLPMDARALVYTLATVDHTLTDAQVSQAVARSRHRAELEKRWQQELVEANVSRDTEMPIVPFFPVFDHVSEADITWDDLRPKHYVPDVDMAALAARAGQQLQQSASPPDVTGASKDGSVAQDDTSPLVLKEVVQTRHGAANAIFGARTLLQAMWQSFCAPGYSSKSVPTRPDTYFSMEVDKPENVFCGDICVNAVYALLDDNEIDAAVHLGRNLVNTWRKDPTAAAAPHAARIAMTLLEDISPHLFKFRALLNAYLASNTSKDPAAAAVELVRGVDWDTMLADESEEVRETYKTLFSQQLESDDDYALKLFRSLTEYYPAGQHKRLLTVDASGSAPLRVDKAYITAMYLCTLAADAAMMANNRAMVSAEVVNTTISYGTEIAVSRLGQLMPSRETYSATTLTIPALEQASCNGKLGVAHLGLLRHVLESATLQTEALLQNSKILKVNGPRALMHRPAASHADISTVLRTVEACKPGHLIADLHGDYRRFHALFPTSVADSVAVTDFNIAINYNSMFRLGIMPQVLAHEHSTPLARALYYLRVASLTLQTGLHHEKSARPATSLPLPPDCTLVTDAAAVLNRLQDAMGLLQTVLQMESSMYSTLRDEITRATRASSVPIEHLSMRPWSHLPLYRRREDAQYAQQTLDFNLSLLEHDLVNFDQACAAMTDFHAKYIEALPNSRSVALPPSRLDHAYTLLSWAAVQCHFVAIAAYQTAHASLSYHCHRLGVSPARFFPHMRPLPARMPTVPPVVDCEQALAMIELDKFGAHLSKFVSSSLTNMSYAMLEIAKALSSEPEFTTLTGKVKPGLFSSANPLVVGQPTPESMIVADHPLPSLSVLHLAYADAESEQLITWTESFVNSMLATSFLHQFHNSLDSVYTNADGSSRADVGTAKADSVWQPPSLPDMAQLPRSPFFVPHLATLATCKQLKGEYEAAEALLRAALWHAYAKPVDTTPPTREWRPEWENSQRLGEAMQMSYHKVGLRPLGIIKEDGPSAVNVRLITSIVQQYGMLLERMGRFDEAAMVLSHSIVTDPNSEFK